MGKDFLDFSPQKLNSFLLEKFNPNLYPFSCFLESVISCSYVQLEFKPDPEYEHLIKQEKKRAESRDSPLKESILESTRILEKQYYAGLKSKSHNGQYDAEILRGLKKRLLNLKKRIIETMIDFDVSFYRETDQKERYKTISYEKFEKRFAWEYELENFFFLVNDYIANIDDNLNVMKKGIPINKRNLLVSIWALFLIEKNQNIDWIVLADIFNWFWKILSPYKLYKDLKPYGEFVDPEYLKNQFFKYKKRWKIQYKSYRHGSWIIDMDGGITVLGQRENEIYSYDKRILDYFIKGDAHPLRKHDNETFLPFVIKLYKKNPKFNNLIVFPDFSYLFT